MNNESISKFKPNVTLLTNPYSKLPQQDVSNTTPQSTYTSPINIGKRLIEQITSIFCFSASKANITSFGTGAYQTTTEEIEKTAELQKNIVSV